MFDESVAPSDLVQLAEADIACSVNDNRDDDGHDEFLRERLAVYEEYMNRPYVMGRDLIEAGMAPDKNFSDMLAYAHKMRLAGVDKESALRQTLAFGRKLKSPETEMEDDEKR